MQAAREDLAGICSTFPQSPALPQPSSNSAGSGEGASAAQPRYLHSSALAITQSFPITLFTAICCRLPRWALEDGGN